MQKERGDKIGKILIDLGFVAPRDVLATLSEQLGVAMLTGDDFPSSAIDLERITAKYMRQFRFLPVSMEGSTVTLAMGDPLDFETLATVRRFTGLEVRTALAAERDILEALDRYYGEEERREEGITGAEGEDSADIEHLRDMASEAPVIRLVNTMIAQALERRASDIHIEPFEKNSGFASASMACCTSRSPRRAT